MQWIALWAAIIAAFGSHSVKAATVDEPGADSIWFGQALEFVRRDKPDQGMAILHRLANHGDVRAQYLLGAAYMDGKWVTQDKVKGYAWLQVAAGQHLGRYFDANASPLARDALLKTQHQLSGAEAIQADQLTVRIIEELDYNFLTSVRKVAFAWTGKEVTKADPPAFSETVRITVPDFLDGDPRYAFGCGGHPTQWGTCPSLKKMPTPRCTGEIAQPDPKDDVNGGSSQATRDPVKYTYPDSAIRRGIDGSTTMLAHIDKSGWVCLLGVVRSSGFEDLDKAAMRMMGQVRVAPATKDGRPIESLLLVRTGFSLGMDFVR